jgi:TolB-like protein
LPEIARELNVDAVIEGSVLRSGERVRVTAQLLDAREDRHLWASSYQGELADIMTLQAQVASDVAGQVKAKLTPETLPWKKLQFWLPPWPTKLAICWGWAIRQPV